MPAISSSSWMLSSIGISDKPVPSRVAARWSKVPSVLLPQAKTLASATTVSGRAEVSTALAPAGESSMESVSGSLLLRLPRDVSAQVSGESFSGSLKATGVTIEKRRGPGASFTTTYGSGSGRVSLETFSGSAEVRVE